MSNVLQTGTITAIGSTVTLTGFTGLTAVVSVSGTYNDVEFVFEASEDGSNFYQVHANTMGDNAVSLTSGLLTNDSKAWTLDFAIEYVSFRIRAISYTSGTANIRLTANNQELITNPGVDSPTATQQDSVIDQLEVINSLVPSVYDYISLSYTADNLTTAVYKIGGSGGTTVSTLTMTYSGNRLTSVTKT